MSVTWLPETLSQLKMRSNEGFLRWTPSVGSSNYFPNVMPLVMRITGVQQLFFSKVLHVAWRWKPLIGDLPQAKAGQGSKSGRLQNGIQSGSLICRTHLIHTHSPIWSGTWPGLMCSWTADSFTGQQGFSFLHWRMPSASSNSCGWPRIRGSHVHQPQC